MSHEFPNVTGMRTYIPRYATPVSFIHSPCISAAGFQDVVCPTDSSGPGRAPPSSSFSLFTPSNPSVAMLSPRLTKKPSKVGPSTGLRRVVYPSNLGPSTCSQVVLPFAYTHVLLCYRCSTVSVQTYAIAQELLRCSSCPKL